MGSRASPRSTRLRREAQAQRQLVRALERGVLVRHRVNERVAAALLRRDLVLAGAGSALVPIVRGPARADECPALKG